MAPEAATPREVEEIPLMWFGLKKDAAPIYKDETNRRMFATASGRPKGAHKLKKMKNKDGKEAKGRRWWLFGRRK